VRRHILRNALLSVVTVIGSQLGALLTGAVLVEIVFAWPGLGRLLYEATLARDCCIADNRSPAHRPMSLTGAGIAAVRDLTFRFLSGRILSLRKRLLARLYHDHCFDRRHRSPR
jgi:peptide/nickel transport system permease protein